MEWVPIVVSFSGRKLLIKPGDGSQVLIEEDGDRTVPVTPPKPIVREPEPPSFGKMKLFQNGKLAASLRPDADPSKPVDVTVSEWIASNGLPERLDVDLDALTVTDEELGPLLQIGSRHQIPISVRLGARG